MNFSAPLDLPLKSCHWGEGAVAPLTPANGQQATDSFVYIRGTKGPVGGRNENCPLTSNFEAKEIHEAKQSALLIAIF